MSNRGLMKTDEAVWNANARKSMKKPVALALVRSSIYVYPIAIDAARTVMISNTDVMGG